MEYQMKTGSHFANAETSERLQHVLVVLGDGLEHTTYEILHQAQVCAVNSIIHELRKNGFDIPKAKRRADRYYYKLQKGTEQ